MQVEVPWPLGPADGRHVLRSGGPTAAPTGSAASASAVAHERPGAITHVVVLGSLDASRRRGTRRARSRELAPEPEPVTVSTGRATVIAVEHPLGDAAAARAWLARAGEPELEQALEVLGRLLHAHRLVTADPHAVAVGRERLIAARVGYGAGEEVADGRWSQARELPEPGGRARFLRRRRALDSEAHLAARLGGLDPALACEELVLRSRLDLDSGRPREAALQLLVALDAAIAELSAGERADALAERVAGLRARRESTAAAAQAALSGPPSSAAQADVAATVALIEAALRARAVSQR